MRGFKLCDSQIGQPVYVMIIVCCLEHTTLDISTKFMIAEPGLHGFPTVIHRPGQSHCEVTLKIIIGDQNVE